jgi:flavin-dependent dehydrogenase
MSKARSQPDVVVLGSHPCCYLASLLLQEMGIAVARASIPDENPPDRLVLINPKFHELHKHCEATRAAMNLTPIYGLKFLSNDSESASEYLDKSIAGYVGNYKQLCKAMADLAQKEKIESISTKTLAIHGTDENGVSLTINGNAMHPKLLIVGGDLSAEQRKMLGLPESWESGVMHRYTFLRIKAAKSPANKPAADSSVSGAKLTLPVSLDLAGELLWGWVLPGQGETQVSVSQPIETIAQHEPKKLLQKWLQLLAAHRLLIANVKSGAAEAAESVDLPLAGALSQDGVANRTLLIGPAGGFYTACSEDIYSNCWSAMFAAEAVKKSINQRHVQDAIGMYRQKWGATLGDYLRGPQQNLRFLLPLVYRNPVMTSRMGEAILNGTSVVR